MNQNRGSPNSRGSACGSTDLHLRQGDPCRAQWESDVFLRMAVSGDARALVHGDLHGDVHGDVHGDGHVDDHGDRHVDGHGDGPTPTRAPGEPREVWEVCEPGTVHGVSLGGSRQVGRHLVRGRG